MLPLSPPWNSGWSGIRVQVAPSDEDHMAMFWRAPSVRMWMSTPTASQPSATRARSAMAAPSYAWGGSVRGGSVPATAAVHDRPSADVHDIGCRAPVFGSSEWPTASRPFGPFRTAPIAPFANWGPSWTRVQSVPSTDVQAAAFSSAPAPGWDVPTATRPGPPATTSCIQSPGSGTAVRRHAIPSAEVQTAPSWPVCPPPPDATPTATKPGPPRTTALICANPPPSAAAKSRESGTADQVRPSGDVQAAARLECVPTATKPGPPAANPLTQPFPDGSAVRDQARPSGDVQIAAACPLRLPAPM